MTPRLSGHFSIFGLVFYVLKSTKGIARQWSGEKFAILSQSLGFMVECQYIERGKLELENQTLSANRSGVIFDMCERLVPVPRRCCSYHIGWLFMSARKANRETTRETGCMFATAVCVYSRA